MSRLTTPSVQAGRIRVLKEATPSPPSISGPVVYWMFRDQRSSDNWALIHAVDLANRSGAPVAVLFNLFHRFLGAHARQLGFMVRGLRELRRNLDSMGIPFFLLRGEAVENVPDFLEECGASALVTDFSPFREVQRWKDEICRRVGASVSVHEVDAHNIVPVWVASGKLEYSAKTIRTKIHRLLPEYLIEFPDIRPPDRKWKGRNALEIGWEGLIAEVSREGADVPEVDWCEPGETAAREVLLGSKNGFLMKRLKNYYNERNDPLKTKSLSGLSPYLHFGQISTQRCALEARAFRKTCPQSFEIVFTRDLLKSVDTFLEEMIVRRELAENFCFYQPQYDSLQGAWEWARKTLMDHASDKREHIYTKEQLEQAKTADPLWNASQLEMVHMGKMHGFMRQAWIGYFNSRHQYWVLSMVDNQVFSFAIPTYPALIPLPKRAKESEILPSKIEKRMYWAKKILEWTKGPEEALSIAIYLNDKYEIDGRDPNGYVGCMWSICGVHDQGWKERPVFGKIRYMNYAGCKRKFDVDGYISYVKKLVGDTKKRKR
ncbi:Deoxyribodipyrimidine photo-lyase [Acorus gramineus]|uniref:Deoxyribodipyrimidine photo-lyase n=1 Tax=Acorus gramineus TaxID=55184 RepID=A0AAV9ABW4_ACOGR|nr:Deoxyribodipyrimidine photo-lyase [Acorus gramineus]